MVGFLGPRPLCPPHSENPKVQARAALVVGGSWVHIFCRPSIYVNDVPRACGPVEAQRFIQEGLA